MHICVLGVKESFAFFRRRAGDKESDLWGILGSILIAYEDFNYEYYRFTYLKT